jgi:N-acetylmuramoyl-L-alanine amidase
MLLRIFLSTLVSLVIVALSLQTLSAKQPQPQIIQNISALVFTEETKREIDCLANNIFFEAAYEPKSGQKAVAFVTLNRMESKHFPNTVCGVVLQKNRNPNTEKIVCQFSWYCEPNPKRIYYTRNLTNAQQKVYNEIYELAAHVYLNREFLKDPTKGALFYHADYVSPGWRNMIHTTTIGRHIFYVRRDLI